MAGVIYLGGGGSPSDEALLWHRMLHGNPRVLYWPFALGGAMLARAQEWVTSSLSELYIPARVETWTSLEYRDPFDLKSFDILMVGGGNTFQLLEHVREHNFLEPIRDFVAAGRCYYGGSAGAVLACDDIGIASGHDPNINELSALGSLGLIHGVAVLPHFDPSKAAAADAFARRHDTTVVGIPEACGVIVSEGNLRCIGRERAYTFVGTGHPSALPQDEPAQAISLVDDHFAGGSDTLIDATTLGIDNDI